MYWNNFIFLLLFLLLETACPRYVSLSIGKSKLNAPDPDESPKISHGERGWYLDG
jgi:hypothetical protein